VPQGKVKWFSTEKAYGFIEQDNDNDIFVHVTGLAEGVTAIDKDMVVEYEVEQGRKGPQATKVRPVTAAAAPAAEAEVEAEAAEVEVDEVEVEAVEVEAVEVEAVEVEAVEVEAVEVEVDEVEVDEEADVAVAQEVEVEVEEVDVEDE
jgi:CspA family cold shock protein